MLNKLKHVAQQFLSLGNNLVDGHRHGSHFSQKFLNLANKPVESWWDIREYQQYENLLSSYTPENVKNALIYWNQQYDHNMISQVIDWSFKSFKDVVYHTYRELGINNLRPVLWNNYSIDKNDYDVVVLDDERYIDNSCIEVARDAILSNKYITIHAMQSPYFVKIGYRRLSSSLPKWLYNNKLLCEKTVLVHMNCCSEEDINLILKTNARVVICPGTAIFLNVPINYHLLNVNFNVGTDAVTISNTGSLIQNALWLFLIGKQFYSEKFL